MRCPSAAEARSLAWCSIRSTPGGSSIGRGSGSSMLAGAPAAACSKEFRSGSISSHPASRPCTRGAAWLKSGTRNGLASWAWTTDWGSAVRSRVTPEIGEADGSGSGSGSSPAWICISRSSRRVASEISASSWSSENSDGSRVAIWARIVARPSSRFSWVSRCTGVSDSSARTLARSARASSAEAWNLARWPEVS